MPKALHPKAASFVRPRSYSKNRKLALWVKIQREAYRKNKLSDDRKINLQSIGFCWSLYNLLDDTKS
jgi:hypothetical protein